MAIPAYPSELPPPLRPDYQQTNGEGRAIFRNDAGPVSLRRRFAAVMDQIPFATNLERWQLGVFDNFYYETTKNGTLPFTIAEPLTDGFPMLDENLDYLLDENGDYLLFTETMLVIFGDQGLPTRKQIDGARYRVDFTLWKLPS